MCRSRKAPFQPDPAVPASLLAPPIFNERPETVAVFLNRPDSQRREPGCVAKSANMVVTAFPGGSSAFAKYPAKANSRQMLPGFRFLFAAIMLATSLMVFGLGAAALLRAAHEEFASNPSWRAAPEVMFAQQPETTKPVLAVLQVGLPATENAQENSPATDAPAEQAAITPAPAESERTSALKPEDSSPATEETAKAEIPVAESPKASEAAPPAAEAAASAEDAKIATIEASEVTHAENPSVSAQSGQTAEPVSPADMAATKIATLGGPPVSIETPIPAKVSDAKPDEAAIRKQQQEKRAAQQRRMAARARVAAQALLPAYPFGQPAPPVRAR
jgi:hypothetical protein